jgi:hypothetical protein
MNAFPQRTQFCTSDFFYPDGAASFIEIIEIEFHWERKSIPFSKQQEQSTGAIAHKSADTVFSTDAEHEMTDGLGDYLGRSLNKTPTSGITK